MTASTVIRTCCCPRCAGTRLERDDSMSPCLLCTGLGYIEDVPLSEHFQLSDLVRAHADFANDPPPNALDRLRLLCRGPLEMIHGRVGKLRVTSGYRSQALDAHVAGPPFDRQLSGHSIGAAADLQPLTATLSLRDVMHAALACPDYDQVIAEAGCVHVALYAPYPIGAEAQRRQAFVRMAHPGSTHSGEPLYLYARYDPHDPTQWDRCV